MSLRASREISQGEESTEWMDGKPDGGEGRMEDLDSARRRVGEITI